MLKDGLNYELDTGKTYKQHQTYHINLERDVPQFTTEETWEDVVISYELSEPQKIHFIAIIALSRKSYHTSDP